MINFVLYYYDEIMWDWLGIPQQYVNKWDKSQTLKH